MAQISIQQIRVLDAVAREKNFSKAARRLGISQPAVSLQLRELQKRYGVKLYTRRGKEIHLSHLGMQLVTTGRKILGLLNEMNNTLTESAYLLSGRLHIGLSCHYFVKGLLTRFMNEYPGVKVKASIGHSAYLLEEIRACRMDIAEITALAPVPGLYSLDFSQQQIILFVARTHAWALRESLSILELHKEKMVALDNESMTRKIFDSFLEKKQIAPNIVLELDNWETMKEVVAAGIGFGIAQEDEFGPDPRLVRIPLSDADCSAIQYFVCQSEYRDLNAVAAFLDIAQKEKELRRLAHLGIT